MQAISLPRAWMQLMVASVRYIRLLLPLPQLDPVAGAGAVSTSAGLTAGAYITLVRKLDKVEMVTVCRPS